MADDPTKHAIDVVAHHVVACGRIYDEDVWGFYDEIGEWDMVEVSKRSEEIANSLMPNRDVFNAAYEHLANRAGDDDDRT